MHLVEWSYGLGSALRSKLCTSAEMLKFYVDLARANGAEMIVVTQVGAC